MTAEHSWLKKLVQSTATRKTNTKLWSVCLAQWRWVWRLVKPDFYLKMTIRKGFTTQSLYQSAFTWQYRGKTSKAWLNSRRKKAWMTKLCSWTRFQNFTILAWLVQKSKLFAKVSSRSLWSRGQFCSKKANQMSTFTFWKGVRSKLKRKWPSRNSESILKTLQSSFLTLIKVDLW